MNGLKKLVKARKFWQSIGAILAVIALCVGVLLLPFQAIYPNLSGEKSYALSDASKQYLQGISEDVEIVYYSKGGKLAADCGLYRFVRRLAAESEHIRVRLEDPEKTGSSAADQSIEIRSEARSKVIVKTDLVSYYNTNVGEMSIEEYAQILTVMQNTEDAKTYQTYLTYYGPGTMFAYNRTERVLISAIRTVLAERAPALYAYSNGGYEINSLLRGQLEEAGYRVASLQSMEQIPGDCQGLYLEALTDLTQSEAAALSAYLGEGGKVFLTTSYTAYSMPNLENVLKIYGLGLMGEQSLLYTEGTTENASSSVSTQFTATAASHRITQGISGAVASYAHRIVLQETEGVVHSELLQTPAAARYMTATTRSEPGIYPVCVLAEKENSSVIWLSMPVDSMTNSISNGANFAVIKQSFDYFSDHEGGALQGISDVPSSQ